MIKIFFRIQTLLRNLYILFITVKGGGGGGGGGGIVSFDIVVFKNFICKISLFVKGGMVTDFSGTSILSNEFVVIGRANTDNLEVLLGPRAEFFEIWPPNFLCPLLL